MALIRNMIIRKSDSLAVITSKRYQIELSLLILKHHNNKFRVPRLESILDAIEIRNERCKDLVKIYPMKSDDGKHTYKFGCFEVEIKENNDLIEFSLWKNTPNHPNEADLVSIYSFYKRFEEVLRMFNFGVDIFDSEFRETYKKELIKSAKTFGAFDTDFRFRLTLAHHVQFSEASATYKSNKAVEEANNTNDMYFHIYGERFDSKQFNRSSDRELYHKDRIRSLVETARQL